jgi:glycosyltransferase involved in cell wall biosynthesis
MKIGMVTGSVSRLAGGLFESVRNLALSNSQIPGSEVVVFGTTDSMTTTDVTSWSPIYVRTSPILGPRKFGYAPNMLTEIDAAALDLIHLHGLWMYPTVAVQTWHNRNRRPYVLSPHGMVDSWALSNSPIRKHVAELLYEKRSWRNASCLRTLCKSEVASVRRLGLANPVCLIPNGVELPSRERLSIPDWRSGLPAGTKVLLFLGRLHEKKGLIPLLSAWKAFARTQNEWKLVIAGWGEKRFEEALSHSIKIEGLSSSVKLIGPVYGDEKRKAFESANAFILPSYSEGLPIAVLEAWSYSVPTLISDACNLEIGISSGAALRIAPDALNLAQALHELAQMSEEELSQMGHKGRDLSTRRFSWESVAKDMQSVYDWLLSGGAPPHCVEMS